MANLKPWEEASRSPAYTSSSPEQQAQMREQYISAGGVIPPTKTPKEKPSSLTRDLVEGAGDFIESAGKAAGDTFINTIQKAGQGIQESMIPAVNALTGNSQYTESDLKRIRDLEDKTRTAYNKRMESLSSGAGAATGQILGNLVPDIAMTVANPLMAASVIATREAGRAYSEQTPDSEGEKSLLDAGLVGGANYAAQRILPGATGTAESLLGKTAQNIKSNAIAGAKGGAVVGTAEAQNRNGENTDLADLIEGAIEEGGMGAVYGGGIGGVHGLLSRRSPQVFDKTPDNVKTDIGAEDERIRSSKNADELRQAYSEASNANAASALNLLDENGFRLTDAVAMDNPAAQRILNTDQTRAEKAATVQEDLSNIPSINPLARPNRRQGKANADNEHNQKQAVAMKDAMSDMTKDNINSLNGVMKDIDARLSEARSSGDSVGLVSSADIKTATQSDREFIDAYRDFYNEANRFKSRSGEDFDNFVEKATQLQKLSENISPEMKQAVGGLKKLKGMPEGFNPIQDAFTLNETSRLMSNQDRGWTSLTSEGFNEASAPSLTKNPIGAAKFALNRFNSSRARATREGQQNKNQLAIRELARSDLEVNRAKVQADEARRKMEETPPEDDIQFKTQQDVEVQAPPIETPVAPEPRSPMAPDSVETPLQRLRRAEAMRKAEAERVIREADTSPEPRGLTSDELAGARRSIENARRSQEPTPEPVVEETPSTTMTEEIPTPQPEPMTARELVEQRRLMREANDRAQEQAAAREAEAQASRQEPTPEPKPQPEPVTARELLAQRRAAQEANARREAEQTPEPVEAPETTPEPEVVKVEPLPTRTPKAPEKAPEPVKPASGIEKLASMPSHIKQAAKAQAERFARSLYTQAAKAKATAENLAAYKGDPRELMRRIRQEDQANNAERHVEMARNQLASQQGIANAKSEFVRKSFSDWVTERGLPDDIATRALKTEEKGQNGNVTSLDSLKRRAERLYQKDKDAEFDRLYEEALAENKTFDKKDAPKLSTQKEELMKEIDSLLDAEPLHPSQKEAVKARMTDLVNDRFKSAEKAGREEALEVGQMRDIWETFTNTYNKEAGIFNKANKNSQYEATAKHLQARQDRLDTLRNKAKARAEARNKVEADRQTLEAIAGQKTEIENLMKSLPEPVRKAQESRTLKQLAAHHDKNSPVPPERFRGYIERIHNAESDYLDRTRRLSEAEEDARTEKWNRMYEQAEELNRRFDIDQRVKRDASLKEAQERENNLSAVQRQRNDIHSRLMRNLEDKGIPREDAEAFAGSYMDNRYSLLDKPMTATEHQNARARIENDVDRFAKKFESLTPIEKSIVKATGDSDLKAEVHGEETRRAVEEAKKVDEDVRKLQDEELEMEKIRAALPDDEKAQANSDIKESIQKQEDEFASKVEKAFENNQNLDELTSIAEILDRVHGADKAGNNRRFIRAMSKAADAKREFGDNPVAWFSADDYSAISKLGAASAGGNKSRALQKIFGTTADQAKAKLLGKGDVEKMRRVIKGNPDIEIPSYKTSNRSDYMQFLEKFNEDGTPKIKKGSLAEKVERGKRQARLRVRVRSKD